jgi:tetratricopeptide (TPR) repeat protein
LGVAAAARPGSPPLRRVASWTLALAVVLAPLAMHAHSRDLRRFSAAADYGRDVLASVPAGGTLFVEGDDAFILAYLVRVRGERNDLRIYDRLGLVFPDQLRAAGVERLPGEDAAAWRARAERSYLLEALARPNAPEVRFATWPGYALPAGLRFEPLGLLYAVRRVTDPPADAAPLWAGYRGESVAEQSRRAREPFGLTLAASYPLMRGERALFEGRPHLAAAEFDRASEIAGRSETLHNYLGTIFGRMGDYARAIRELELAATYKPTSIRAWNNLGFARQMNGDADGAREAWQRSLRLDPGQPEIRARLRQLGE